ncbi:MAG TPA: hypothetical protein VMY78_03025, partial [Solirubrobacteraceae bacterium]|nr:hypothetical protein [Solirubrobacteraceae bacterium]
MKLKAAVVCGAVVALAIPVTASAGNGDKATGGGQVLLGDSGKASTIAFTAQGTTETAKGQVQFIDRSAGAGQNQTKYHGVVDCIEVTGNSAIIGGYRKKGDPNDPETRFVLRVTDNGEPNQGQDLIQFDNESDAADTCGDDNDDSPPEWALAH